MISSETGSQLRVSTRQITGLMIATLVVATAWTYLEVRTHHFVWDTIPFVLQNPWVHEWSVENVLAMFTEAHRANWHPVVLLSHAMDFSIWGNDSGGHHITNLVLHIINTLLLFWLVHRIVLLADRPGIESLWIGFLTAAIFALHPQHVESVAWVVERKDVLYTAFALACLGTYCANTDGTARRILPFVFFLLSIGAKPMAVTLPVVLVMLDIFPRRTITDFRTLVTGILAKWHYLLVSLVVAIVTLLTQSEAMPGFDRLPQWARTLNAIDNSLFYVQHYLVPTALSPFYPYPEDASYLASPAFWLPGALFLLTGTVVSLSLFIRGTAWPGLLFAFYLVTLLPVSGLIHVGPAKGTDHYVYMATIPFSMLTAIGVTWAWTRLPRARAVIAPLCLAYLLGLTAISKLQVSYWNNPLALWGRVIQLYPESPFGHRNIASGYAEIHEWQLALQHAELSLQLGSPDTEYVQQLREKVKQLEAQDD